jgi:hypothetical protein
MLLMSIVGLLLAWFYCYETTFFLQASLIFPNATMGDHLPYKHQAVSKALS